MRDALIERHAAPLAARLGMSDQRRIAGGLDETNRIGVKANTDRGRTHQRSVTGGSTFAHRLQGMFTSVAPGCATGEMTDRQAGRVADVLGIFIHPSDESLRESVQV